MKIYLAGCITKETYEYLKQNHNKYLLQTYYDLKSMSRQKVNSLITCCDEFLLDSGAFTFMNSGKKVDWKEYIDSYCDFVNEYDIRQFIELDLDHVIGIEDTKRVRDYIEKKTKKKKEAIIELANEYKGIIPQDVYEAVVAYQFDIRNDKNYKVA